MSSTARPAYPLDKLSTIGTLGTIGIDPPLDDEQIDLLTTIAVTSLRSSSDDRPSALVERLAPGHPDGPSEWLACDNGCCLTVAATVLARPDSLELWLRYIVGTLLVSHRLTGALVMYDHTNSTFRALVVDGHQVRRRAVLAPARSRRRRDSDGGPRMLASV